MDEITPASGVAANGCDGANAETIAASETDKTKNGTDTNTGAEERLSEFARTFADSPVVLPQFKPLFTDLILRKSEKYLLRGGNGSCLNTFLSTALFALMEDDPKTNAVICFANPKGELCGAENITQRIAYWLENTALVGAIPSVARQEWTFKPSGYGNMIPRFVNAKTFQSLALVNVREFAQLFSYRPDNAYPLTHVWYCGVQNAEPASWKYAKGVLSRNFAPSKEHKGGDSVSIYTHMTHGGKCAWFTELYADAELHGYANTLTRSYSYLNIPLYARNGILGQSFFTEAEEVRQVNPEAYADEYNVPLLVAKGEDEKRNAE